MVSKFGKHHNQFQIFIQSPDLETPNHALIINPNLTIQNLKQSLLPQSSSFYLTHNGKPLMDSSTISMSQITPLSTLILRYRLSGGGGDGGSTCAESRDCYLNMYAERKPDKVDPNEKRLSKWMNCAFSFEPLKPPCVVDRLGNLFNKEALVEGLLGKKLPKAFSHVKGLKDMIKIEFDSIPGLEDGVGAGEGDGARFQCPVSGLEFNGKYKFFAIRTCGHVLSAKALKEVKSSSCIVCHKEFSEMDKIPINGSVEDVALLREKMEEEKLILREKKMKKVKNGEVGGNSDSLRLSGTKHGVDDVNGVEKKISSNVEKNGTKVNGANGVLVKGASNGPVKKLKADDVAPANATSKVYASIFTSSSKKSNFRETYSCRSLPLGRN